MELYSYIILEVFLFFNIFVRYNYNIKSFITVLLLIIHILIVRNSGFDGDISVYMDGFHQDRSEVYYLKEILFWLLLDFYGYFLQDNLVFLVFDYSILFLILIICKKIDLKYHYASMFFVTFFNILGHQNIYRQWIAGLIFLYFYVNRSKLIYLVAGIHNALSTFIAVKLVRTSRYSIFAIVLFLPIGYLISSYIPEGYQEVDTGSNFVIILNIIAIMNFVMLKWMTQDDRVTKFFLYSAFMVVGASMFLSTSFSERMVYLYLSLIMPFTLYELDKKSKTLTFLYCFILIIPSFFTNVMMFLN